MGTIEKKGKCLTCACEYSGTGARVNDCPGHFGHIELARPVYHCGFIDDVVKILRCVCFHCSQLLIDRKDHRAKNALAVKDPETRLRLLHELCRPKRRCEVTDAGEDQMEVLMNEIGVSEHSNPEGGTTKPGCGALVPKYTRKGLSVEVEFPDGMEEIPGTGEKKQVDDVYALIRFLI